MDDLERRLRTAMGDIDFENAYMSAFGRLRADRFDDYPRHSVTLLMVQDMLNMQNGGEPTYMPFGAPGVPTPEPDSLRIIQWNSRSFSCDGRSSSNSSRSGCYIATAIYGSYDCPQVLTLRRYRDYTLSKKWYGRLLIRVYYAVSPTLVKWFGNTAWIKSLWLGCLERLLNYLQQEGVADTPYED